MCLCEHISLNALPLCSTFRTCRSCFKTHFRRHNCMRSSLRFPPGCYHVPIFQSEAISSTFRIKILATAIGQVLAHSVESMQNHTQKSIMNGSYFEKMFMAVMQSCGTVRVQVTVNDSCSLSSRWPSTESDRAIVGWELAFLRAMSSISSSLWSRAIFLKKKIVLIFVECIICYR